MADVERAELPKLSKLLIEHSEYGSLSELDKLQVKESITSEYNLAQTGIELVGWNDCNQDDVSDVIVFSEDQTKAPKHFTDLSLVPTYHGCSSIGDESPGSLLKRFVLIKKLPDHQLKITSAQALEVTALHEFGHLLGLRHEHARRFDAGQDVNCYTQGIALIEAMGKTAKQYAAYDPNSMMNYCFDFSLMNKTGIDFYVDGLSEVNLNVVNLDGYFYQNASQKRFNVNEVSFTDDSLVTKTKDVSLNAIHYQVKIGLSKGDRHTLRCMYDSSYDQKNCNPEFRP